ncbi:thrombospondin type-1 domain-containing protein 4-like [Patiria miniata]|uniref:ADAMTS/ADAMTS-like Spacer 1 domain-containing protein n=1 Tax=Patiria miniata TaxID=46514 RepID=A0A914BA17_PATMI|nr:thrombospondin type-1 domain-containing protein 4-like [Patiria miniata]
MMCGNFEDAKKSMRYGLCSSCFLLSKTKTMTFKTVSILLAIVFVTSSGALNTHRRIREKRGLMSRPPVLSYWGNWESWSACSRTCGGGVAAQSRVCLMRNGGGELRESTHCVGLYKQYKLCNPEPCPDDKDFRQEQCGSHNNVPFMGKLYQWKSIEKEPNLCELNCKAVGSRFFAKLADKVVDGTPCRNSSRTDICVDGMCKAIGCDGILGSGLKLDKCGVCGGTNTQCEVMSGVFTGQDMGHGYHRITTIPTGAMYINITELTKSRNYLALEGVNGNKYINMDWKIDAPGNYSVAGTYFIYKRTPGRTGVGEQLFADGPTTEDLNLILINQQKNPGISYEYSVPKEVPSGGVEKPPGSSIPQPSVAPVRGQVIIRPEAPPSRSQVADLFSDLRLG